MKVEQFREEIRKVSGVNVSDEAWNSMLVRIPRERTDLLKVLANRYSIYMLSNTSDLHEIGYLKPDLDAWKYVINDAGIKAEETLSLDDNIQNIKASQELGFDL